MQARIPIPPSPRHPFDLAKVLDGSQDFRWCKLEQGWYSGVLHGHIVHVRQDHGHLEYCAHVNLQSLLASYFRLHEDVDAIYDALSSLDPCMAALAQDYPWVRVLRQPDPWECTVAYICSARNNVGGISRNVEKISEGIGERVRLGQDVRCTFPSPERVLDEEDRLRAMGLGLKRRNEDILEAARRVHSGKLDLSRLASPGTPYLEAKQHLEAKQRLMQLPGVGPKVASCIALFSLDKPEAFPIDIHIRKALMSRYFPPGDRVSDKRLEEFARARFGKYAGWAGQLLFQSQWNAASLRHCDGA